MIEIQEEDIVPVSDALMAGPLGGLGQSITHWIMSRGAKHLRILSQSGPRREAASTLIEELETKAAMCWAVLGDNSDESIASSVMTNHANAFSPYQGIYLGIHGLKVSIRSRDRHSWG